MVFPGVQLPILPPYVPWLVVVVALDAPPADRQHQQKKRPVRSKKKQGSPEVVATLSGDEGSDSADEYHDALPGQSVNLG